MIRNIISFIFICLQFALVMAQGDFRQADFLHLTEQNGLGNNTLADIYQDCTGFVWLATDAGLSRHDGVHFHNYNLTDTEPINIKSISETEDRYLWLETEEGLACFDKQREIYIPLYSDNPDLLHQLTSICTLEDKLYAITPEGINQLIITKETNKIKIDAQLLTGEKKQFIRLCTEGENLYAVDTQNELLIYSIANKRSTYIPTTQLGINNARKIETIYAYKGKVWICSEWAGITCYDVQTQTSQQIACSAESGGTNSQGEYVRNIINGKGDTFIVSTWTNLYQITPEKGSELNTPYKIERITPYLFSSLKNKITKPFFDKKNNMVWAGTFGNGFVRFRLPGSYTGKIILNEELYQINGIAQDANGYIWLATHQNGIYKSTEKSIAANTRFVLWEKSDGNGSYCMFKDKNSNLWLGDEKGNVVSINPVTNEVNTFIPLSEENRKNLSPIRSLFLDSRNHLWLAMDKGLAIYDCNTNQNTAYMPYSAETRAVNAIAEDGDGVMWIGTDKGVKNAKQAEGTIRLTGEYEKKMGLNPKAVIALYVNNYNRIFASYLNKIIQIDGSTGKATTSWMLLKNLPQGRISCMVDDKDGNTWLGSNEGVLTIHNKNNAYYSYAVTGDYQSVCRLNDGRLVWATSGELNYFDPRDLKEKGNNKHVLITDLDINNYRIKTGDEINGQVVLDCLPGELNELNLNNENNNLTLYVSDLSYETRPNRILYRLLPLSTEWIETYNNKIEPGNLKAGSYTLEIKPVSPGSENEQITTLLISVSPHPALSIWAIMAYILILATVIGSIIKYMNHKDLKREQYMEKELQLKEELQEATESRKEENENHHVRNQMQSMIAKELRTPLSLITGPLREMVRTRELPDQLQKQALMAYRSAICIQDSCNQLLDIYQQESYNSNLQVAPYPASKVSDSVVRSFQELLNSSPIKLQYDKDNKINAEIWIDLKKIEFVLRNILSNAYRRISYSGSIWFSVSQTIMDDKGYCLFCLSDEGKKITDADNKAEGESETPSNELGFKLMEMVAEAHHGKITINHKTPESTQVIFCIPLGKKHFDEDENITFIEPEEIILKEEPQEEIETILTEEIKEQQAETVAPKAVSGGKNTVLVIEDHQDIRLYLQVLFSNEYNVLTAENGEQGLKIARKELPDLVITDVMMPVMTGFECCRLLKEDLKTCHIPVILLTALVEDEDVVKGIELGADDYILKPFNPEILRSKAKRLIRSRQELKQVYTKLLMPSASVVKNQTEEEEEPIVIEDPFIAQILQIVNDNLQNPDFSVKKLAEMLNMSQPTLYRRVKQITNFTIIELIRGVRLKRSAELLRTRQHNVQEVAEMVGYNDIPTFRKHFVDFYGTTPSSFNNKDMAEDKK